MFRDSKAQNEDLLVEIDDINKKENERVTSKDL